MNLDLPPLAREIKQLCHDFAAKEIREQAAGWWEREEFPSDVFLKMGELDLMGMLVPEQWGGSEAGMLAFVAGMEEIGGADQSVGAAWNAHTTIGTLGLLVYGTDGQKERWLRPLAEGKAIAGFGLTEPEAGSDAAGIRTTATRQDGGWRIDGQKTFISNAGTDISLGVTILAKVQDEGSDPEKPGYVALFVPTGTEGYVFGTRFKKLGWHALDTRELFFEGCWVSDEHVIGDVGSGLKQFLQILDPGRISVAALSLSLAQACLEMATEQARNRRQFGRRIGDFQAIRHKLADMAVEVEAARALVYRAAWLYDEGREHRKEAAIAKLYASEVANRVASEAVQIHGGMGYILESRVSRFYADAKVLEIGEGTNEIQRDVIGRLLLGRE